MRQRTEPYLTPEDYLFLERNAETKSEYCDGETFAMYGASEAHNLIVANLVMVLARQLKLRPCKIYASDMRVKVQPSDLYTYPDGVLICGKAGVEYE
ncbi:MAG: Uma2 family endonuclease [Chloroflexi bacterium]|nr:Uma2 family endonuclease [Chloroflexota bacterium]